MEGRVGKERRKSKKQQGKNINNRGNVSNDKKPQCRTGINNRKLTNLMGAEYMEEQQEVGALSLNEIIHRRHNRSRFGR